MGQPEPGPEDQEPDAGGKMELDEPLDLRCSEAELQRELRVPGQEPQQKPVRVLPPPVVPEARPTSSFGV